MMKLKEKPVKTADAENVEKLYLDLLAAFYHEQDRPKARKIARVSERVLARDPAVADSIRGQEIASLIAELRGNLDEAIHFRESEIRKIFELHSMTKDTPHWDYVFRRYDYSDIGDRLDLLARLYADKGDRGRAEQTLRESKQFCEAHGIPFDGADVLDDVVTRPETKNGRKRKR